MKEIWRFFCCFAISLWYIIRPCHQLLHNIARDYFTHSSMYSRNFSIFMGVHLHLIKNISMGKLCTQHSEGTCELVFSLYGSSPFHLAPICFILPPHCSSTDFKMLWTSACSKNGALNWNLLLWYFNCFSSRKTIAAVVL